MVISKDLRAIERAVEGDLVQPATSSSATIDSASTGETLE
jgi:hypothetical protein